jgi:acetate kinase
VELKAERDVRVLAVNPGSSTLKLSLVEGEKRRREITTKLFGSEVEGALGEALRELAPGAVDAAAVRVVHGGTQFRSAALADDAVVEGIESLAPLAPLHQPSAVAALRALASALPGTPRVACFDTAFHATLAEEAFRYAVPRSWLTDHGVRRFGFHGLSYAYLASELPRLAGSAPRRAVLLHLGSGASACALSEGVSVDTTMGMTPLEGLVMGTRPGVLDPGVVPHLLKRGVPLDRIERALEKESGLRGLSGSSSDYRTLVDATENGDIDAALALGVFEKRVASGVAQMAACLGGLDALVYSGGIGENVPTLRTGVAQRLAFLGLALDQDRNHGEGDREIGAKDARARTFVLEAREDVTMAREAAAVLGKS